MHARRMPHKQHAFRTTAVLRDVSVRPAHRSGAVFDKRRGPGLWVHAKNQRCATALRGLKRCPTMGTVECSNQYAHHETSRKRRKVRSEQGRGKFRTTAEARAGEPMRREPPVDRKST